MKSLFHLAEPAVPHLLTLAFLAVFPGMATSQNAPMIVAFSAPSDTTSYCPTTQTTNTCFLNFVQNEHLLSDVSGIGIRVPWGLVDDCYTNTGSPPQKVSMPCTTLPLGSDTTIQPCPMQMSTSVIYDFCALDTILEAYVAKFNSAPQFANKKLVLIINAINDGTPNNKNFTPDYVFSTSWASVVGSAPQDVVVCNSWQGNVTSSSSSCPVSGTFSSSTYAVWNIKADTFPFGNCATFGTGLACTGSACTNGGTPEGGFPIPYEKPFMVAYQNFLQKLAQHYNVSTGNSDGQGVAPYIAYVRAGLAEGGENQPFCSVSGPIPQATRSTGQTVPAGYVIGTASSNGTLYVATGPGTTDHAAPMPTCSPTGCTTAPDGTVPGWYNAGLYPAAAPNAIWPGPAGAATQATSYTDNGYLTTWASLGITGYVTSMTVFLKSLNASFPFDISAHNGPPSNGTAPANVSYADSEAIVASANGVGFGMQSVSINDSKTFATGTAPTTATDWAYNFKSHPAPVHHLQMYQPGGGSNSDQNSHYFAARYPIYNIYVDTGGTATVNCGTGPSASVDCSPYSGEFIYVSGNGNPALNGIWSVNCSPCATNTLQFSAPIHTGQSYTGGMVWAPNYWPIVMPFAVQHNVSTIEVYECDLDYAYGSFPSSPPFVPSNPTTTWVDSETGGGCADWGVPGSDVGYQNSASDTLIGQPPATSIRTGSSILINGTQF
jgi:hypothetical protein